MFHECQLTPSTVFQIIIFHLVLPLMWNRTWIQNSLVVKRTTKIHHQVQIGFHRSVSFRSRAWGIISIYFCWFKPETVENIWTTKFCCKQAIILPYWYQNLESDSVGHFVLLWNCQLNLFLGQTTFNLCHPAWLLKALQTNQETRKGRLSCCVWGTSVGGRQKISSQSLFKIFVVEKFIKNGKF